MRPLLSLVLGLVFTLAIVGTVQASAIPSTDFRIFVSDPEGFETGGGTVVRSLIPLTGQLTSLNDENTLNFGERIVSSNEDVYVADEDRISRITLDSSGLPTPNNVDYLTDSVFGALVGIAVDSNGIVYVADSSDNTIYAVDPQNPIPVSPIVISNDSKFVSLRDIAIYNDQLYVLDNDAESGNGAIYKIDLTIPVGDTTNNAVLVYSDNSSTYSLHNALAIEVSGANIYVSGSFVNPNHAILKINIGTHQKTPFLNSGLTYPTDLVVDEGGNDLYVVDSGTQTIFRSDLTTPSLVAVPNNGIFHAPTGITTFVIGGSLPNISLNVVKQVNATSAPPGSALLYTITATNEGPDSSHNLIIHDLFPNLGANTVESYLTIPTNPSSLYFTSEVHTSQGISNTGSCARVSNDAFKVDCSGFGTLDPGDLVVIHLIGKVNQAADGIIRNTAIVEEPGIAQNTGFVDSTVVPSIGLSFTKTASVSSVTAGLDSIDYTITATNPTATNAENVMIVDNLPSRVSSLTVTSQPTPNSCQIISNPDGSSELRCGPYNLINTIGTLSISYSVNVDSDAINPLTNTSTLTCDNCNSQTTSVNTQVLRESDLSIQKESEISVNAGDSLLYTLTITNDENSPSNANDVVITDHLPAGVIFNPVGSSHECSFDSQSNNVICNIVGSISPGGSITLTINVDVNPDTAGTLVNIASVTSSSLDTNQDNNQVTGDEVTVIGSADLSVSKTAISETVAGRVITYQISVINAGPSTAANVQTYDFLPSGLSFVPHSSDPQSDPDCHDESDTIICEFGNVNPGTTTKTIQIRIGLAVLGDITNEVEVFSESDSTSENNRATAVTNVLAPYCGRAETDFDSVIYGTEGKDNIKGTKGDDLIFGYGGNDNIHGRDGDDCIIAGDGKNEIHGDKGDDTIIAGNGNNKIHGDYGNDTVTVGVGDNYINGGKGDDTIVAGNGNNRIHGDQGVDNITTGDGDNRIWGGQNEDNITTGNGSDHINGNQGNDHIVAGGGDDWIHGGEGDDYIDGGADTDKCNGASGNNTIVNCEVEDKKMKEEAEDEDNDKEDKTDKKAEEDQKKLDEEQKKQAEKDTKKK